MGPGPSVLFLILFYFLRASGFVLRQAGIPEQTNCRGGFDVYFVLDTSGSIGDAQDQSVNFVEELFSRFIRAQRCFTNVNAARVFLMDGKLALITIVSKVLLSTRTANTLTAHVRCLADRSSLRVSFITFNNFGTVQLPLTGDRNKIREGLQTLRGITPKGGTSLSQGLSLARSQIEQGGDSTASVVIALTDGQISSDRSNSELEANSIRNLGGSVLAVRVGDSSTTDLVGVADMPPYSHIFQGDTFDDLENVIAQIIDTSCVEILSVSPDVVCSQDTFNVSIYGNGFHNTIDTDTVFCNFKINGTDERVKPFNVTPTYLSCKSPKIPEEGGIIEIQVSVNGKSFVSSNVTIEAEECEPPSLVPWISGFLAAIFLLALLLLWWFWNLLCCAAVKKEPEPALEPTPVPVVTQAPPKPESPKLVPGPPVVKKWPKVDVSLIGGVGAGGIRPVPVRWGAGGNTEAAKHLERGKQAEVVGQLEIETEGELVPANPETMSRANSNRTKSGTAEDGGCCCCSLTEKFKNCLAPFKSLYDKVSLMRPQPGGKGLCCA